MILKFVDRETDRVALIMPQPEKPRRFKDQMNLVKATEKILGAKFCTASECACKYQTRLA